MLTEGLCKMGENAIPDTFLKWSLHMKSDRSSCVKTEKELANRRFRKVTEIAGCRYFLHDAYKCKDRRKNNAKSFSMRNNSASQAAVFF